MSTADRNAQVVEALLAGETARHLAARLGLSHQRICQIFARAMRGHRLSEFQDYKPGVTGRGMLPISKMVRMLDLDCEVTTACRPHLQREGPHGDLCRDRELILRWARQHGVRLKTQHPAPGLLRVERT